MLSGWASLVLLGIGAIAAYVFAAVLVGRFCSFHEDDYDRWEEELDE